MLDSYPAQKKKKYPAPTFNNSVSKEKHEIPFLHSIEKKERKWMNIELTTLKEEKEIKKENRKWVNKKKG